MSNPTSNFNWQMPTSTDLVTDLPADFEVFGQAVDTSLADLKGGTTGQVLAKASNADMDFVWSSEAGDISSITASSPLTGGGTSGDVTVGIQDGTTAQKGAVQLENSTSSTSTTTAAVPASVKSAYDLAGAAIPKSTVTTNGDLIYGTGSGTVGRIGIGSSGQILSVSGGVPSWQTVSSGSRTLIASGTLSGASVTVSSIPGTYQDLYIVWTRVDPANNSKLYVRVNGLTSGYASPSAGVTLSALDPLQSEFQFQLEQSNTVVTGLYTATIPNYAGNTVKMFLGDMLAWNPSTTVYLNYTKCFNFNTTTSAITSLNFRMSTGNFDGGSYYVYGVN